MDIKRSFSLTEYEEGVWVEIDGEECFRLRAASAPEFQEALQEFFASQEKPNPWDARKFAIAQAGIAEWKNLTIGGEAVGPYSPELAEKLLEDWPKLARRIEREINVLTARSEEARLDAEGNSEGSSAGG
ncbi:MAG: hypothetical protein AB7O24_34155 [Kofleriaceae bacterium]